MDSTLVGMLFHPRGIGHRTTLLIRWDVALGLGSVSLLDGTVRVVRPTLAGFLSTSSFSKTVPIVPCKAVFGHVVAWPTAMQRQE
jgi:hypothetical protein